MLLKNSFINENSLSHEFFECIDKGVNVYIRLILFVLLGYCRYFMCLAYYNIPVMCYGLMLWTSHFFC